jgi:hypothetical protein
LSNALLVFDYQSTLDFKFAGAYVGGDNWVIGHRNTNGWVADALVSDTIDALVDYQLKLVLEASGSVSLHADGVQKASYRFADSLNDGLVGLGTRNAISRFDDFFIQAPPALPASLAQVTLVLQAEVETESAVAGIPGRGEGTVTADCGYCLSPAVARVARSSTSVDRRLERSPGRGSHSDEDDLGQRDELFALWDRLADQGGLW